MNRADGSKLFVKVSKASAGLSPDMNHGSSRLHETRLADVVALLFVGDGVFDDTDEFFVREN